MINGRRVSYEPMLSNEPETPEGSLRIRYNRFVRDTQGDFVEPESMGHSDYSCSTTQCSTYSRSNIRVFKREFTELQGVEWWQLYGGHGTEAIVVRRDADERFPELGEFFDALESYPIADEDDHSKLEIEMADEAWESYGLSDFVRWLEQGKFDLSSLFARDIGPIIDSLPLETAMLLFQTLLGVDLDQIDSGDFDSQLNNVWWEGVRNGDGEEVRHEDAVNVYFDYPRGMRAYLSHVVNQNTLSVALDHLQANGGEWDEAAEELVRAARPD